MPELFQVTPFVLCLDLQRQIEFYSRVLGFSCAFQADNYAYLKQGPVALRLLECPAQPDGKPLGAEMSFSIDTDDVDQLYQDLLPGLRQLAPDRVRAPFDQPYGQREFHVIDEDGALVFFWHGFADLRLGAYSPLPTRTRGRCPAERHVPGHNGSTQQSRKSPACA